MTTPITLPLGQPLAKALLLFRATDAIRNLDRVILRVDKHGAQWEATDSSTAIFFRPDTQTMGLPHGIYEADNNGLERCAGIPKRLRVDSDDLVSLTPATGWPDIPLVCPLLTGRESAPFTADGLLLARLHAVGRLLGPTRNAAWSIYAGGIAGDPVVCLPAWIPSVAGRLMVVSMPMKTNATPLHRTSDGWMASPRTPQFRV